MNASIVLIDSTEDSLTVSWPAHDEAPESKYSLQYRTAADEEDSFQTLSNSLRLPQARKRNLQPNTGYFFRARPAESSDEGAWITHINPFLCCAEQPQPAAPTVTLGGTSQSLLVQWEDQQGPYELQLRQHLPGDAWSTIATNLSSTQIRKKNLPSPLGYQFRVRTVQDAPSSSGVQCWSSPSAVVVPIGLHPAVKRLMGTTSLRRGADGSIPLAEAIGGKEFLLLYASAHWCGPCRSYTPQLVQWYNSAQCGATTEVVFVSADHDERGFAEYFRQMPWLAIDYDDDAREDVMGKMRVRGIPQLTVVDARTGRILVENAVGKPLDTSRWRNLLHP